MKNIVSKMLIASSMLLASVPSLAENTGGETSNQNPLLQPSTLPFGAPDFSKIKASDFLPAFDVAIVEKRKEIDAITANKAKATFANTIRPYEDSGQLLDRVSGVFFTLTSADKTPEIAEAEKSIQPLLTKLSNDISLNPKLFARIKYVYDHERQSLKGEDRTLLDYVYQRFVHSGALLPADKAARLKEINSRISELQRQWGTTLVEATNAAAVWVDDVEELKGLSDADIAQCQADAKSRGGKAPYCIVIVNTTQQPILASLDNRDLRRRVYEASVHRADGTNEYNTLPIVVEIAKLRAEKAQLMGYRNYAEWSLQQTMAKTPETVDSFLKELAAAYKPKADAETKAIEDYARQTMGPDFHLQPYDRFYYSAKMKQEQLHFTDADVAPYLNADSVLVNGVFYAAHRAYGLSFKERHDIPTWHSGMHVFEVIDKDGRSRALFYTDYYRRPTKSGGAWMDEMITQNHERRQLPVIYNVCNMAQAPAGQPTQISWDWTTTEFHEFGHALHGMLSDCYYKSLAGANVPRDFVEMPSQFNESFATIPEIFDNYAKDKDGNPMPEDLKANMLRSVTFQGAYNLGELLAASCLDMKWHELSMDEIPTADKALDYERKALEETGLYDEQIPARYLTSYFNHVWGGGYAAGYYSYSWTNVFALNVAQYFAEQGALDPKVGQAFRDKILSRGRTREPMEMFTDFTGYKKPDVTLLLKASGL